jgi:hypothetical protein
MSPALLARKAMPERRARRSDARAEAVQHYLDAVRMRCHLDAIIVAERGRVVAHSAPGAIDLDSLVRIGKGIVGGEDAGSDDLDVFAHEVFIGDSDCLVVTTGRRVESVKRVAIDLARMRSLAA